MTYRKAIEYLYSLTDYEKRRIERYTPDTLDLARVERLLAALGNPHQSYSAIHIAGTKGKGSTAAMIESSLRAAGFKTGLYTSPHLHTFRERIRVEGSFISRDQVTSLVEEMCPLVAQVPGATTFEVVTAMALAFFARQEIEILVAEVGLGGRLDATNVLQPEVSVITSLSLDHTYILGKTLPEIAQEKAGIIKSRTPVVSAPQRPEAMDVIEQVTQSLGSPLVKVGEDWIWEPGPIELDSQSFVAYPAGDGKDEWNLEYRIPLLGRHQLDNATTALATLEILQKRGFDLSPTSVAEGLRKVQWPGRMEILSHDPLVIADCAHNPYSVQVLRTALEEWFPGRQWVLIYGAFIDKNIPGMLQTLLPITAHMIVTRSQHPRAAAPVKVADFVAAAGGGAEIAINLDRAFQRALDTAKPDSGILITGSVSLVGEARETWAHRNGQQPPENDSD